MRRIVRVAGGRGREEVGGDDGRAEQQERADAVARNHGGDAADAEQDDVGHEEVADVLAQHGTAAIGP